MIKNIGAALVGAVLLATAACGGSSSSSGDPKPASTPTRATTAAAPVTPSTAPITLSQACQTVRHAPLGDTFPTRAQLLALEKQMAIVDTRGVTAAKQLAAAVEKAITHGLDAGGGNSGKLARFDASSQIGQAWSDYC